MVDDRELWACAALLMQQHGDRAWMIATERAKELRASGDAKGHETFLRIVARIDELQRLTPRGPVH